MGFFFTSETIEQGNSYIIDDFPADAFNRALVRHYKTTKLSNLFSAVGMSFFHRRVRKIKIHKFFIPELKIYVS